MATPLLYEEWQPSGNSRLRRLFMISAIFFLLSAISSFFFNKFSFQIIAAFFIISLICIIGTLVSYMRLVTQVRTDGIYVSYFPIQPSFRKFAWADILDVYPRRFDPLSEYGGWGIRYGPFGSAYILSGNEGIQIVFHDKKRLLISTTHSDELMAAIQTARGR